MNNRKKWLLGAVIAGALGASAASAQITVDIDTRPPPPRVEQRPPPPRPDYVWADGYWRWDEHRHAHDWVAGRWIEPHPGQRWAADRWEERGGHYHYVPGHWEP